MNNPYNQEVANTEFWYGGSGYGRRRPFYPPGYGIDPRYGRRLPRHRSIGFGPGFGIGIGPGPGFSIGPGFFIGPTFGRRGPGYRGW